MRKLMAMLLAAGMVLAFTACSYAKQSVGQTTDNQNETQPAGTQSAETQPADREKTIAVVAKGESHAFWQAVKAGAESAANDKGYRLTFSGSPSESPRDLPGQIQMVQTALSDNADGLVLATIGEGFTDLLTQASNRHIPVIQFDSGIWKKDIEDLDAADKNPILSSVATSNILAAEIAAENFFNAVKEDIAASSNGYVVGIIQHDESKTGIDRADGFEEKFTELANADAGTIGKYTIEKEVRPGEADGAYQSALEALYEKGAKAVFMTNEGAVNQVYDAVLAAKGKYDSLKFCGFDAGSQQIRWIKASAGPKLVGSVAQNSFQIGYDAVLQCINAVEGEAVEETVSIPGTWYDTSNIDECIAGNLVYEG